ncbi:methyltransferase domain-containing protein [Roseococcus sp. SDR]|uniref:methyltransferase domain-containing protein n=1 Tax=Roseococcus sp. SDR TaxID=2835532 RepID=UPI001BCECF99|nr:methyltransferase domain-containing protein [Roseococcus sp. SDR]MBS7792615.1 methyltransferase domain-containing protein [Roseococcus sp. SDR]MBV1847929.1 methyltransferase domain-containing protein [Roseococcus sp. SDR]
MSTASERQARRVQRYYRWLDGISFYRERRAAGEAVHPVHRALADPTGGPPSPLVIHRLMLEGLALPEAPRVLDAGCGYGATMLDLAPRLGGDWTGLTLSPEQAARGNAALAVAGLSARVRVQVQSYDAPPAGPFDLIYGIESLIHSADPRATLAGLAQRLAPGGHLLVVDDMPEPNLPPEPAQRLAQFKQDWRCPVAPDRDGWIAALRDAGLELVGERDLNPLLQVRGMAEVAPRLAEVRRRSWLSRSLGFGVRAEAEIGGLLLESLQTEGWVHYRLLAARKPA